MQIRKAVAQDIPELLRLRILFLNEVNGRSCMPSGFKEEQVKYLNESMADDSFIAWIAEENGKFVATSGMCFYQVAPNYSNPSGRLAYIQNMFTLPEYRGRVLASSLFAKLIEEAKERGYRRIVLHATADGRKVYEKFGFAATEDEMILKLK